MQIENASSVTTMRVIPQRAMVMDDRKLVTVVALLTIVLTGLPYVYGYLFTPRDLYFMGIVQNAPDSGEYFAWMRESMQSVLISNTLTPEPNAPAFFNLVFWLLGQLARVTGLSLVAVYQFLRILSAGLFVIAAYAFCAYLVDDPFQRRIAFLLVIFGSGLSLHITLIEKVIGEVDFPAQFFAEGTTLYSMVAFPLLMLGAALFTFIFILALRAYQEQKLRYAFGAGVLAFVLGWSHGYDLILVYAVLGVFTGIVFLRDGWRGEWLKSVALIFGLSVWAPLYMAFLTRTNTTWREALAQFVNGGVFTPNPLGLVGLLGLPLVVALITFDGLVPIREREIRELFVKTWFGVNLFLMYLPVEYQIHFINGFQVPMALLATRGLFNHILPWLVRLPPLANKHTLLAGLFIVLVAPTGFYFIGQRILDLSRHQAPYFFHRDQIAALEWLQAQVSPEDVVFSSFEIGHFIPGLTGARPMLAHWAMTLRFYEKRRIVERFFQPTTADSERRDIVERFGVTYVYWSDAERAFGSWNPETAPFLERVFSSSHASIYRVKR
jgi:hypothetical protein